MAYAPWAFRKGSVTCPDIAAHVLPASSLPSTVLFAEWIGRNSRAATRKPDGRDALARQQPRHTLAQQCPSACGSLWIMPAFCASIRADAAPSGGNTRREF